MSETRSDVDIQTDSACPQGEGQNSRIVLAVDDDPFCLRLLERHLQDDGYTVVTASDGKEALRILLHQGLQLVVTDGMMPEMGGLDLCRALRAHEGVGLVFIIVLTANTNEDYLVEAFQAGADDYVTKPFKKRELLARLHAGQRLLDLQRELDKRTMEVHRMNAELAVANKKFATLATTDELTGLVNRRDAMERLNGYWASAKRYGDPLSCIILDIDHFKKFNDTYGHAVGDSVLRETAHTLQASVRRGEIVCRVGGEEFLVICPKATVEAARKAAERFRRTVAARVIADGENELFITISLGLAGACDGITSPDQLLKAADDALYAAKAAGRNCVRAAHDSTEAPAASAIPS